MLVPQLNNSNNNVVKNMKLNANNYESFLLERGRNFVTSDANNVV